MARWVLSGSTVFFVTALGVVGHAGQAKPAAANAAAKALKNPVPASVASVGAGKAVFAKYCLTCHGAEGKGDGAGAPKDVHPADLTDAEWKYGASDGEIFANIHDSIGPKFDMKSWKSRMTDAEIWSVVNYLRSIAAKPGSP